MPAVGLWLEQMVEQAAGKVIRAPDTRAGNLEGVVRILKRIRPILVSVLAACVLLNLSPPLTVAAGGPDSRFGVVEAYADPAGATALGAGWERITFRWNEIQPNGPSEWNVLPISNRALDNELAQGREVVGLLVTTPGWATDLARGPGVPQGLYLPTDDPNNLWAKFVRTIVGRYAGRIDHWIIWNEPDIRRTRHMSWGGSVEDFIQLLRAAYMVANETNPEAVIHLSAVTHWWDEHWFGQFLDALVADPSAAANSYYFDAATLHIYFRPETVYELTAHYYRLMHSRGIYKPIWIAETNAAPSQDSAWPVPDAQFNVSLEEQAFFVAQALSLGIAAGAERFAVYKMADTETDRAANPEPFGLVRSDGSRRPAFTAYQVVTGHLAGFRRGSWDRRDEISVVTIDRGVRTTTVVWARAPEPQTVVLAARAARATLVDVWGDAGYVYPEGGYYSIDLPGANCTQGCLMGGEPLMLVEEARVDDTIASPFPSPTLPPAEAIWSDVVIGGDPLVTPTASVTSAPTSTPTSTPMTAATAPPICAPTATVTHSATATWAPGPSATSVIPSPAFDISSGRRWLLIGVFALAVGGVAVAARRTRPASAGD